MEIIVVSGNGHSVGKTTLVREMIKRLKNRVGVIKSSIHAGVERLVTDDLAFVETEGTDTALFYTEGAEKVVFLQTDEESLQEDFQKAIDLIGEKEYLIIEGNRVLEYINPDLIVYISRQGVDVKPSAVKAEARADLIIDSDAFFAGLERGVIPFELTQQRITCYKAHLVAKVLGISLAQLGQLLDEKGIKVKQCQLGLFK